MIICGQYEAGIEQDVHTNGTHDEGNEKKKKEWKRRKRRKEKLRIKT